MGELATLLWQLVAIDSVNPHFAPERVGEGPIGRFVVAWLRRAGLAVTTEEVAPGRVNVIGVARGTGGGRALLLCAHLDTVGVEEMVFPFVPRIVGNRVYGRGACDTKAGLAAALCVAAAWWREPSRGDVIVAAVVDEEHASIGARALVRHWRPDAAVVVEPTGLDVCIAHPGALWIAIEITRNETVAQGGIRVDVRCTMRNIVCALRNADYELHAQPPHVLLGTGSVQVALPTEEGARAIGVARCRLIVRMRILPGETADDTENQIRRYDCCNRARLPNVSHDDTSPFRPRGIRG